jgi:hypothetical protein
MEEKENLNKMEKNNTNNMDEKVHYEIKFTETEDGFRLEATGDKKALKRLGIGPNMVGRRHQSGRARRARALRKVNRQQKRLAAKARRLERMNQPWAPSGVDRPGRRGPGFGPWRRFPDEGEYSHAPRKGQPHFEKRNHRETWDL